MRTKGHKANAEFHSVWWLFTGQTVSILGTNVTLLAMPWVILNLTHSAMMTSVAYGLEFAPYILFSIPLGLLVDAVNRKKLMIVTNIASAVALLSVPMLDRMHLLSTFQVYVVIFILGTLAIVYQAASSSAIPNLVSRNVVHRANSLMQTGVSIGSFVGAPLAGLLMNVWPASTVLAVDAGSYLFASLCLLFIRKEFQVAGTTRKSWSGMFEGVTFIRRHKMFRSNMLVLCIANFASNAVFSVLVYHMREELHASSISMGLVLGVWGVGLFLGSSFSHALEARFTSGAFMVLSRVCAVLSPLLFLISHSVVLLVLASICTGFAMVLYNVQSTAFRQLHTPDALRGRVTSAHTMVARLAIPMGAAVGGALAGQFGASSVFWLGTLTQMVALIATVTSPLAKLGIRGEVTNPQWMSEAPRNETTA